MKNSHPIVFILIILTQSCCNQQTRKTNEKQILILEKTIDTDETILSDSIIIINYSTSLSEAFSKAIKIFPSDSGSLYRFYYKWFPTADGTKQQKQIDRIESLVTEKSIRKYRNVEKYLKPLMVKVITTNTINHLQLDSLVTLYSDYDFFRGEALLSNLLTNDENYQLVWKSFQIIANQSSRDTTCISALIRLNDHIRTNVELAEAMQSFIEKAICHNPEGFLDMYLARRAEARSILIKHLTEYEEPDKEMISILTKISKTSKGKQYQQASTEILDILKKN